MKRSIREPSEKGAIRLLRLEVGAFKANCYLLWDKNKNCVTIDPGEDAEFIEERIRELSLVPNMVLLTHGHLDHHLAAVALALAYNIPVFMSRKDVFLLKNSKELPPPVTKYLVEGGEIRAGAISLSVLEVPGHSPGSLAFKVESPPWVFCGDVFFADGSLGRTDFGYSDKETLLKSIRRLNKLPPNTIFCPGHGEEFGNL